MRTHFRTLLALSGAVLAACLRAQTASAQITPPAIAEQPLYVLDDACVAKFVATCVGGTIPDVIPLNPYPKYYTSGNQTYLVLNTHFTVPVFPSLKGAGFSRFGCLPGEEVNGESCKKEANHILCPNGYEAERSHAPSKGAACLRVADYWSPVFSGVHQSCSMSARTIPTYVNQCKRALPSQKELSDLLNFIRSDYLKSLRVVVEELRKTPTGN